MQEMSSRLDEFESALLALNRVRAGELLEAEAAEITALQAIETLVQPALERIGCIWQGSSRVSVELAHLAEDRSTKQA